MLVIFPKRKNEAKHESVLTVLKSKPLRKSKSKKKASLKKRI